jgi:hypothetical protein
VRSRGDELLAALDAIGRLRKRFAVLNPRALLSEWGAICRGYSPLRVL